MNDPASIPAGPTHALQPERAYWAIRPACDFPFRFAVGATAGAEQPWGSKVSLRRPPSRKRSGSKRAVSMPSLRKAWRSAGGHRGIFLSGRLSTQVGTFALLPQIVRPLSSRHCFRGIADAQGVRRSWRLRRARKLERSFALPATPPSAVHRAG